MKKIVSAAVFIATTVIICANDIEDINYINKLNQNKYYKESITELEIFLKKYPNSKLYNSAQNLLAYNYYISERFSDAKVLYERIKSTEFRDEAIYYLLTIGIKEKQNDAIEKQAKDVNVKSIFGQKSILILGDYYIAQGDKTKAEECFKTAAKGDLQLKKDALLKMCLMYYNNSEYAKTVAVGEEFLTLSNSETDINIPQIYYMLAYSNNQIGEKKDAIKYYSNIVEKFKESTYYYESINNLMVIYNNDKDTQKAFIYAVMLNGSKYENDGMEIAAKVSYDNGEYSKAEELYKGLWNKTSSYDYFLKYVLTLVKQEKIKDAVAAMKGADISLEKNQKIVSKYYYYYFYVLYNAKEYNTINSVYDKINKTKIETEDLDDINRIAGEANFLNEKFDYVIKYLNEIPLKLKDNKVRQRLIVSAYKINKLNILEKEYKEYDTLFGVNDDYAKDVYIAAGNCYAENKKYQDAEKVYRKYLSVKEDGIVTNNLLSVLIQTQKYDEVITMIDKMDKNDENSYLKAMAYAGMGKNDEAAAIYSQLINGQGIYKEKSYEKAAEMYFKIEKYDEALKICEMYFKDDNTKKENIIKMLDIKGRTYLKINKFDNAIAVYDDMVNKTDNKDYAYFMMGEISYNARNYDKASKYYRYVIDNFKESEYKRVSYYWIVNIAYQKGENDTALKYADEFLKNYTKGDYYEDVLFIVSNIYGDSGNIDKSNLYYEKLFAATDKKELKSNITEIVLKNNYNSKKYAEMPKWIEKIESSGNKKIWNAMYLEKIGRTAEAVKIYEEILDDPEVGDKANFYLGSYYFSIGKYDVARGYFEKVFDYSLSEYKDDAVLKIGFTYDEEKNSARAISTFMRIKLLYPDSPLQDIATIKIGENYEQIGDLDNAIKNYEDFYNSYKESQYYNVVVERLMNLKIRKKDLKGAYGYYRELKKIDEKRSKQYDTYFKNRGEKYE